MRKGISIILVWLFTGCSIVCGQYIPFPGPGKRNSTPPGISIAHDTSLDLGSSSTGTITQAYTTSGTNRMLYVACDSGGNILTSITYNLVSLTLVDSETTVRNLWLYALENPALGTNNIIVNSTPGTNITCVASSFTGVNQTGQPYAETPGAATGISSGGTFTLNVATTANNDWLVAAFTNNVACTFNVGIGTFATGPSVFDVQLMLIWNVQPSLGTVPSGIGLVVAVLGTLVE